MEWIEIKDGCELPKMNFPKKASTSQMVLVSVDVEVRNSPRSREFTTFSHVEEGFYDYSTGRWYDADVEPIRYKVTAWMYKPEPFKKQGETNV